MTSTATVTLDVRNFTPRDVGFSLNGSVNVSTNYVCQISGVTNTGTSLTPVATTSGFKLASVGPGDYEFTIPALPFISTTEKKVVVSSATNDTSSLSTLLDVGSRTARTSTFAICEVSLFVKG